MIIFVFSIKERNAVGGEKVNVKGFQSTEPLEIPKELWLMIDHVHKNGMKVVSLQSPDTQFSNWTFCNLTFLLITLKL